jgi:hypothetical protein
VSVDLDQLGDQLGLGQLGAQLVYLPGPVDAPVAIRHVVCCPSCRQRVREEAGALRLHWHGDGTQCPAVWPAYVAGAPTPRRRPRRPVTRRHRRAR